jgi:hypothetical protein
MQRYAVCRQGGTGRRCGTGSQNEMPERHMQTNIYVIPTLPSIGIIYSSPPPLFRPTRFNRLGQDSLYVLLH